MMSARNWTPEQSEAITNRKGTVIVSAAAGSGKTAVLVERIIRRITSTESPCDADRLLIVTFTRAATAEMRSRLESAVRDALETSPFDEHLQRQQMLIPSANIYTIDAFCCNLVRENFDKLNISPDFTMIDEGESQIMQHQAAETVVEQLYESDDADFKSLVELTFAKKDDSSLEENIIKLYSYSRAYPSPDKWLDDAVNIYDSSVPLSESPLGKLAAKNVLDLLRYHESKMEFALNKIREDDSINQSPCIDILDEDLSLNRELQDLVKNFKFEEASNIINTRVYTRWDGGKGMTANPTIQFSKEIRTKQKDDLSKIPSYFCGDENDYREDLDFLRPLAGKLVEAVKLFEAEFSRMKKEKNALDFSDVELLALKLLVEDPAAEDIKRTELAKELGNRFEEILIDEYQDTNKAQDMIFTAISNEGKNLFMVGDVKQSIYSFRQAMPDIFIQKKNTLENTVILGKNFRSRKGVTDYINFVFSQIMSEDCGDVIYDEKEQLVFGANYEEDLGEPEVELHIVENEEGADALEHEANCIAQYIISKLEEGKAEYRDFAILMQTLKGRAATVERVLREKGIPVHMDAGNNFFSTADISVIVSFLRIIDNPLSDIPLLSVMMSPIFGFTPDEMAKIRINDKYSRLYAAVFKAGECGDKKVADFLSVLRKYRRLCISMPVGELIRLIYEDTSFPAIVSAMPGGKQRSANLLLLAKMADSYSASSNLGLSGFVRYIDKLIENNIDTAPANILSESSNVVRIMSVHKSKGLEFKYCILADTNKPFNTQEQRENLILHPAYGIGLKGRDLESGNTYPTLIHKVFCLEVNRRRKSESLRVLYVALTRAREKLVIFGSAKAGADSVVKKAVKESARDTVSIPPYSVRSANSFLDWIMITTISHPSAKVLRDLTDGMCKLLPADFPIKCVLHSPESDEETDADIKQNCTDVDEALVDRIRKRIDYKYPYLPLTAIPTKRSASHVDNNDFSAEFFATSRPEFASKSGFTPAERGTLLHRFMQYADFDKAKLDIKSELERLVDLKYLTEKEAQAVDLEKARNFFSSDMFKRLEKSPNVMREKKFAVLVPAGNFEDTLSGDMAKEPVLIQGIADCIFEENNKLYILDYKTDRETDEEVLKLRHTPQLKVYKEALSMIFDLPIDGAYLYSLSLGKDIKVL